MPRPNVFSFTRYLAAKKSVDDRALNRHVWETFQHLSANWDGNRAMRLLEIGCGIGTMVERLAEWDALPELCEITAIDEQSENIQEASGRLSKILIPSVTLLGDDLYAFAAKNSTILWDVVVSNAVLDLLNIPEALRVIFSLLNPGGLFLFTINFDGVTIFEPEIDPIFDQEVLQLYHRTMDERIIDGKHSGDSHTGRHLFNLLRSVGASILAAGSSDWVVYPKANGYVEDEGYFLHFIIHTIQEALQNRNEIDHKYLEKWIEQRHTQVERGELVYIAHQIDFTGVISSPT